MPRPRRMTKANYVYHVLNRGAKKGLLFGKSSDYLGFEKLLVEASSRVPMRILAYCLMPNHWHLLLWPLQDGDLSRFVKWLATTHACRWAHDHGCVGNGAVYQSRFKSIPIEQGQHLFWAWRYVERNALRANLVSRAENWEWASLRKRISTPAPAWLDRGPISLPPDWTEIVNLAQTDTELEEFRRCMKVGKPFGSKEWLSATVPTRGRPNLRNAKKEGLTPSSHTQRVG
jgi:putative transposase